MDIPDTGAIFTLGKSHLIENHQSYFFVRNDPVKRLISGPSQGGVICESGRLFVWGENQFGQLGTFYGKTTSATSAQNGGNTPTDTMVKPEDEIVTKPTCVKSLKALGIHVADVAFGMGWSVILTNTNTVYFTGRNIFADITRPYGKFSPAEVFPDDGQFRIVRKPFLLDEFDGMLEDSDEEFMRVASGDDHFMILTSKGRLIGWGSNNSNQLGLLGEEQSHPVEVKMDSKIINFACGPRSTLILTDKDQLFITGQLSEFQFPRFTELPQNFGKSKIISLQISQANEIYIVTEDGNILRSAELIRNKNLIFQKFYDYPNEENGTVLKLLKGNSFYAALTRSKKLFTTFSESGHHLKTFREISKLKNLKILDFCLGDEHILVLGVPKFIKGAANRISTTSSDLNANIRPNSFRIDPLQNELLKPIGGDTLNLPDDDDRAIVSPKPKKSEKIKDFMATQQKNDDCEDVLETVNAMEKDIASNPQNENIPPTTPKLNGNLNSPEGHYQMLNGRNSDAASPLSNKELPPNTNESGITVTVSGCELNGDLPSSANSTKSSDLNITDSTAILDAIDTPSGKLTPTSACDRNFDRLSLMSKDSMQVNGRLSSAADFIDKDSLNIDDKSDIMSIDSLSEKSEETVKLIEKAAHSHVKPVIPVGVMKRNDSNKSIKFDTKSIDSDKSQERVVRPRTPYPSAPPLTPTPSPVGEGQNDTENDDVELDLVETAVDSANNVAAKISLQEEKTVDNLKRIPSIPSIPSTTRLINEKLLSDSEMDDDDEDRIVVEFEISDDKSDTVTVNEIRFINDGVDVTDNIKESDFDMETVSGSLSNIGSSFVSTSRGLTTGIPMSSESGHSTVTSNGRDSINGKETAEVTETAQMITASKDFLSNETKLPEIQTGKNSTTREMATAIITTAPSCTPSPNRDTAETTTEKIPNEKDPQTKRQIEDDERTTASVNSNASGNNSEIGINTSEKDGEPIKIVKDPASSEKTKKTKVKKFLNDLKLKGKEISCKNNHSVKVENEDDLPKLDKHQKEPEITALPDETDSKTSKICTIL